MSVRRYREACQPRLPGTALPAAALQRVSKTSRAHVEFVSHCAPDHGQFVSPDKLTVAKLRAALAAGGIFI